MKSKNSFSNKTMGEKKENTKAKRFAKVMFSQVSVCPGGALSRTLHPGGPCPGVSVQGRPPLRLQYMRAVRILLECILVYLEVVL